MKKFLLSLLGVLISISAFARDFTYTYEGQTLTYTILSESAKTVSTKPGNSNTFSCGNKVSGYLVIPSTVVYNNQTYTVTEIGYLAFYQCSGLTSITIPNSVTEIGEAAFWNCSGLTSITIPNSVTEIGEAAFNECTRLTSVTIGNSVTEIGDGAFYECSGLTSVTIPNSVTEIGDGAFYECSGLTSLTIPNSVTEIGSEAFYGCSGLTSVIIGNSVTEIGQQAFYGCSGLTKAEFASIEHLCSIKFFDASANPLNCAGNLFINNSKITNLIIPTSISKIGEYAFSGCTCIESLKLKRDQSPTVYYNSFSQYMYENTKLGVPASYPYNPWGYFNNISTYNPAEFTYTYKGQTIKYYITDSEKLYCKTMVQDGSSISDSVELPEHPINEEDGEPYTLVSIGNKSFADSENLKSIIIPQTVKEIEESAFANCESLKEVTFKDGSDICTLAGSTFSNCTGLKSLYIGRIIEFRGSDGPFNGLPIDNLKIGSGARVLTGSLFAGLEKLQSVTIPKTTNLILTNVFKGCSGIKTVTFEESSEWMFLIDNFGTNSGIEVLNLNRPLYVGIIDIDSKEYACEPKFSNCSSLTTINFGKNITTIAEGMFSGCTSLRSITIPEQISEIKDKAFAGCTGLASINIEDSSTPLTIISSTNSSGAGTTFENAPIETIYLGRNVEFKGTELSPFKNNPKLLNLTIGNKVTAINHYLFYGCSEIKMLAVPSSVKTVGNFAFYDCNKSRSLTLSASVESIGEYAFYNCNSLSRISIPNSVETIGDYAFRNCNSATKITLGKKLKSIGNFAFLDCFNATEIDFGESVEQIGNNAFYNCSAVKNITIPNSTVSIGDNAFTLCIEAESITVGNKVKTIGSRAFSDCTSVKEITLGSALEEIGDFAFFNCEDTKAVHVLAQNPPRADENVFSDYSAKLYVPKGNRTRYNNSTQNCWPLFSAIIEEQQDDDAIDDIFAPDAEIKVYNTQGIYIGDTIKDLPHGIYIIRQGGSVKKVAI